MGGHTTASLDGDDIAKVIEKLGDKFNEEHHCNPGDDMCEWSITGPNHMNYTMMERIEEAIIETKHSGTFRTEGDVHVMCRIFEEGKVPTVDKGPFEKVNLDDRYGTMPYRTLEDSGVSLSDDFLPAKGLTEREVENAAWSSIDSQGSFRTYVENMKNLSKMIKRGKIEIDCVQCEDEDNSMDIRIGPNNHIEDREWEGQANSEDGSDDDDEGSEDGSDNDDGSDRDSDDDSRSDNVCSKKRNAPSPAAKSSPPQKKQDQKRRTSASLGSATKLSKPSGEGPSLSSLTADEVPLLKRRELQQYCMESKCCKGNAATAKMIKALQAFLQK